MVNGCASGAIKFLLFSVNFLISILGLAVTGYGAYWLFQGKNWSEISSGSLNYVFIGVTIAGAVTFLISYLGCCGAAKNSGFMLLTYALIMTVFLVAKIVAASYLLAKRDDAIDFVYMRVENVFSNSEMVPVKENFETFFRCCELNGPPLFGVPKACCPLEKQQSNSGSDTCDRRDAFKTGCPEKIRQFLQDNIKVIPIALFAISGIELVAAIFSCILSNRSNGRY